MSLTIGSNIQSLIAQRHLGRAGAGLFLIFEKLSTGQRINRASDDAAGLSIAMKLHTDARVYDQAIRNVNDGISYLSIAEGAFDSLKNILIRVTELSEQAANGVYADKQRLSLHQEAAALAAEYNRILDSASFNDRNMFLEKNSELTIQAGIGLNGILSTSLKADDSKTNFVSQLASITADGVEANASSINTRFALSADGRYAVFHSQATNLIDGVSGSQVYRKDLLTGEIVLVSSSESGAAGNGGNSSAAISADGRYVVFNSGANNLIDGVSGALTYRKDLLTGEIVLVSSSESGAAATGTSGFASMSADGRYAVFLSTATNLIDGVSGMQIYRKDLLTGEVSLVSSSESGATGNGTSSGAHISADGKYAVFRSSSTNLIDGVSGNQLYRKDLLTGEIVLVSSSESGAAGSSGGVDAFISADGRYAVFHSSSTNLIDGVSGTQIY